MISRYDLSIAAQLQAPLAFLIMLNSLMDVYELTVNTAAASSQDSLNGMFVCRELMPLAIRV